jgi:hypothetical protein
MVAVDTLGGWHPTYGLTRYATPSLRPVTTELLCQSKLGQLSKIFSKIIHFKKLNFTPTPTYSNLSQQNQLSQSGSGS